MPSPTTQTDEELRERVSAKLAKLDQGEYLGKGGYDQCTEEIMRLFKSNREQYAEERVKEARTEQARYAVKYVSMTPNGTSAETILRALEDNLETLQAQLSPKDPNPKDMEEI